MKVPSDSSRASSGIRDYRWTEWLQRIKQKRNRGRWEIVDDPAIKEIVCIHGMDIGHGSRGTSPAARIRFSGSRPPRSVPRNSGYEVSRSIAASSVFTSPWPPFKERPGSREDHGHRVASGESAKCTYFNDAVSVCYNQCAGHAENNCGRLYEKNSPRILAIVNWTATSAAPGILGTDRKSVV